jgi:hypothetical protein
MRKYYVDAGYIEPEYDYDGYIWSAGYQLAAGQGIGRVNANLGLHPKCSDRIGDALWQLKPIGCHTCNRIGV